MILEENIEQTISEINWALQSKAKMSAALVNSRDVLKGTLKVLKDIRLILK